MSSSTDRRPCHAGMPAPHAPVTSVAHAIAELRRQAAEHRAGADSATSHSTRAHHLEEARRLERKSAELEGRDLCTRDPLGLQTR